MTWRWSWHPWGPICCGLLSAVVAVYLMQLYIDQQLEQHQPGIQQLEIERVDVVVANQPLAAGQTLALAMLSARQVPRAGVAVDTLHPGEANWLVGQQLAHPVNAGQPVQRLHVRQASEHSQFSDLLKPGQRALTLNVSAQQSHAGLIQVGDQVDFFDLSSVQPRLLDNAVEVIAAGTRFIPLSGFDDSTNDDYRQSRHDYRTLSFAIRADKVPAYELLQRNHQLAFWLRASTDQEVLPAGLTSPKVDWIIGGVRGDESVPLTEPAWL